MEKKQLEQKLNECAVFKEFGYELPEDKDTICRISYPVVETETKQPIENRFIRFFKKLFHLKLKYKLVTGPAIEPTISTIRVFKNPEDDHVKGECMVSAGEQSELIKTYEDKLASEFVYDLDKLFFTAIHDTAKPADLTYTLDDNMSAEEMLRIASIALYKKTFRIVPSHFIISKDLVGKFISSPNFVIANHHKELLNTFLLGTIDGVKVYICTTFPEKTIIGLITSKTDESYATAIYKLTYNIKEKELKGPNHTKKYDISHNLCVVTNPDNMIKFNLK